jgi:hypothetical protein
MRLAELTADQRKHRTKAMNKDMNSVRFFGWAFLVQHVAHPRTHAKQLIVDMTQLDMIYPKSLWNPLTLEASSN